MTTTMTMMATARRATKLTMMATGDDNDNGNGAPGNGATGYDNNDDGDG